MRDYDIKRGHWKHVADGKLLHLMQDAFGEVEEEEDGTLVVTDWAAFDKLAVKYVDKTTLRVDTDMNTDASGEDAQRTIRTFNDFLELATGFNAKKRRKRAKKKAKEGEL